jgi:hypothetical protein
LPMRRPTINHTYVSLRCPAAPDLEVLTPLPAKRFRESNRLCCGKTNPELEQEVAGAHPEHLAALGGGFFKKEADLKPHRVRSG